MLLAQAPRTSTRVERYETIVIGAGQAGLAVGHHLAARNADFVSLSNEARVGDDWRRRWDSSRLFTPARYSGLPGMPFPAPPSHLPDKDEVGDYLERYAERFDLPVRTSVRVERLTRSGGRFVVRAGEATYEADSVVVATGAFQSIPPSGRGLQIPHRRFDSDRRLCDTRLRPRIWRSPDSGGGSFVGPGPRRAMHRSPSRPGRRGLPAALRACAAAADRAPG